VRARERQRWERAIERVCAPTGLRVFVVWARHLPNAHGAYVPWPGPEVWIVLDENRGEVPETIAHECAHVLAYHEHGPGIQAHGPEWRAWYRRCKKSLDA
jgi:predicted SprT family Zn-dependent metalloprotease